MADALRTRRAPAALRRFAGSRTALRRFAGSRAAVAGAVVLSLVVLVSVLGEVLWQYSARDITDDLSQPPSARHPMGTDAVGHDLLAQVLAGTRTSVLVGLLVALLSTAVGTVYGAVSGFYGGRVDAALMRFVDLVLTVPGLAVLICLSVYLGGAGSSPLGIALVLVSLGWVTCARVVRAQFLSLRERDFVEAARCVGAGSTRIVLRHLLPNSAGPIVVNATLTVAFAILAETTLSYLGLGIQAPDTSLGLLVQKGQSASSTRPWLFYFPGLTIVLVVLCVNFIGDGLRGALGLERTRRQ